MRCTCVCPFSQWCNFLCWPWGLHTHSEARRSGFIHPALFSASLHLPTFLIGPLGTRAEVLYDRIRKWASFPSISYPLDSPASWRQANGKCLPKKEKKKQALTFPLFEQIELLHSLILYQPEPWKWLLQQKVSQFQVQKVTLSKASSSEGDRIHHLEPGLWGV